MKRRTLSNPGATSRREKSSVLTHVSVVSYYRSRRVSFRQLRSDSICYLSLLSQTNAEEQQGEQRIQCLVALAQNWNLLFSFTFCWKSNLKASPDSPAMLCWLSQPKPNHKLYPFLGKITSAAKIQSCSFTSLTLMCLHNHLVPPVPLPFSPGWRNGREDSSPWLLELSSHLAMGVDTGKSETFGAIYANHLHKE